MTKKSVDFLIRETIQQAKSAAIEAIKINLEAYQETGKAVPESRPIVEHLENPDFADLLFTHVGC